MDIFEDEDVVAKLTTKDGAILIRKSMPETFEIARKLIDLSEKRLTKCEE